MVLLGVVHNLEDQRFLPKPTRINLSVQASRARKGHKTSLTKIAVSIRYESWIPDADTGFPRFQSVYPRIIMDERVFRVLAKAAKDTHGEESLETVLPGRPLVHDIRRSLSRFKRVGEFQALFFSV